MTDAAPLQGPPHPDRVPLPANDTLDQSLRTGLLLTDDDLDPGPLLEVIAPVSTLALCSPHARSPLMVSENVTAFAAGAVDDVLHRFDGALGHRAGTLDSANAVQGIVEWAQSSDLGQVVMWRPMVGPASDTLDGLADQLNSNGIRSVMRIRDYDARCWPHATAGFFKFKKRIPDLLEQRQFGLV